MVFLAWKLLSVLICFEGQLCLPSLVGIGHSSQGLGRPCSFWPENLSRILEAQNVLVRALASGKSTLRDGGPRSVLAQAVRPI